MTTDDSTQPLGLRARIFRTIAALVAIGVGLAVLVGLIATKPEPPRDPTPEAPLTVLAMDVLPVEVRREFRGYGVARAVDAVNISAEVEGVIVEKPARIDEGVRVDRGELIVRIDPSDYRARLANLEQSAEALRAQLDQLEIEAEAAAEQVDLAQQSAEAIDREIARLRDAAERGAATQNEIDQQIRARIAVVRDRVSARERLATIPARRSQIQAQLDAAQAQIREAERNLGRTAVESPLAGIVQTVDVEAGERVRVGDRIARVVDPSLIETPLRLPLAASRRVRVGDAAVLSADGPGGGRWRATVARLAPEADPERRTMTAFVELSQDVPEGRAPELPPGRFLLGVVYIKEPEPRVVAPRGAVVDDRVMVIGPEGEVESRPVVVEYYIEADHPELVAGETQWAVIERGLEPGERIAVTNLTKLRSGLRVDAASAAAAFSRRSEP